MSTDSAAWSFPDATNLGKGFEQLGKSIQEQGEQLGRDIQAGSQALGESCAAVQGARQYRNCEIIQSIKHANVIFCR